ncbi:hypothetical protein ISF_01297 [Cordyceps fumosorosea ARSEF 2679]|uniref:RRM domain-containing protein n=1 Tax=Cordyceps fumosorosea (strain ARSEF 2679) TaxID=1081104 RepID=A0A162LL66_CORFA|nr:hypothetical protein ISF_01297 [Cordyceps fumosorosea ARSEF 2679]OAA72224.1 hypothetical protein ISF_01297 [Cordyceps fumosorosea ARSEF 2679]
MTTYYTELPEQLAAKWTKPELSEDASRSPSRNPADSHIAVPKPGLEKRSISLDLVKMPQDITIQQLYKAFSPKGNIELIDIFEPHPGARHAAGRIVFTPPPKVEFWQSGRFDLDLKDDEEPVTIYLKVFKVTHENTRSSDEQRFPSIISMRLKSLDFGSLLNNDTMVISETIDSTETGDLSLEVNARTGAITLYFQFPEKKRYFSGKRQYRLITNVSAISKV